MNDIAGFDRPCHCNSHVSPFLFATTVVCSLHLPLLLSSRSFHDANLFSWLETFTLPTCTDASILPPSRRPARQLHGCTTSAAALFLCVSVCLCQVAARCGDRCRAVLCPEQGGAGLQPRILRPPAAGRPPTGTDSLKTGAGVWQAPSSLGNIERRPVLTDSADGDF